MERIIELRKEGPTAGYITDALRLQAQCGHEYALNFLKALGVERELAQRLLALRYDRRRPLMERGINVERDAPMAIRILA